ncbi:MAG TPA: Gfo/Idh/MocA family oxidoreductase, partial [Candidatus Sulfotelmatobacter sp.]
MPKTVSKRTAKAPRHQSPEQTQICRVALIGFGTVGRAVAKILCENGESALRLTHICNRNVERKKQAWVPSDVVWTDDVESVLNSDVDIVIELIGGLNPAEQIVRTALGSGKSVV